MNRELQSSFQLGRAPCQSQKGHQNCEKQRQAVCQGLLQAFPLLPPSCETLPGTRKHPRDKEISLGQGNIRGKRKHHREKETSLAASSSLGVAPRSGQETPGPGRIELLGVQVLQPLWSPRTGRPGEGPWLGSGTIPIPPPVSSRILHEFHPLSHGGLPAHNSWAWMPVNIQFYGFISYSRFFW